MISVKNFPGLRPMPAIETCGLETQAEMLADVLTEEFGGSTDLDAYRYAIGSAITLLREQRDQLDAFSARNPIQTVVETMNENFAMLDRRVSALERER